MNRESVLSVLKQRFSAAISRLVGRPHAEVDPQVRPAGDPAFGDYQCNAAMHLARTLQARPREIAERIVEAVDLLDARRGIPIAERPEIAGPGFINLRISTAYLSGYLGDIPAPPEGCGAGATDRLGMEPVAQPQRVVIDYSSPNIAKQMHVGHLRSTIIGDVIARVLAFEGHTVIRQNHVGDWGTQFGMLIEHYAGRPLPVGKDHEAVLAAIEADYRAANERFQRDPTFAEAARRAVGRLQGGDPAARAVWEAVCAASKSAFRDVYARLGVLLEDGDVRGESFYNAMLAETVAELREKLPPRGDGAALEHDWAELREDQGAVCVFFYKAGGKPMFTGPDGSPLPLIIRKSDGAYLYATTDLAAIRYRLRELRATRVLYVVGAPTKLHLEMVFAAARLAGWLEGGRSLEHVSFGQVLGEDRKLLRTRSGGAVRLRELLDEAERRALEMLADRGGSRPRQAENVGGEPDDPGGLAAGVSEAERREIARRIGIAAIKYADLRNDRNSDYVFTWDKLLSLQGNTAPYMLYAYARIRSIYRKAAGRLGAVDVYAPQAAVRLSEPAERALALRLVRFREAIDVVAAELTPNVLCGYLYELAGDFMRFYEACPVLAAADEATRLSRLRLCDLSARTLRLGLWLLGIEVVERM